MRKSIHDNDIIQNEQRTKWLNRFRRGWRVMRTEKHGRITGAVLLLLIVLAAAFPSSVCKFFFPILAKAMLATYLFWLIVFSALVVGGALIILSRPFLHDRVSRSFICAGVVNRAGQPPSLIRRYQAKEFQNCTVWELRVDGIPIVTFQDLQGEIQAALNINQVDVREGKDRRTVLLYTVPPTVDLGDNIMWSDGEMPPHENIVVLGHSYISKVEIDLDSSPHTLIAGATGSGKSVAIRVILRQRILWGDEVIIADFKGGVDFTKVWHENAIIITQEEVLLSKLEEIIAEMETRKAKYLITESRNITEYRKDSGEGMRRIIVAVDEIGELFDKAGADKARKELLSKIENALSTIARQGRAFGVHLVLGTQRPDANVLPGQIRSNLDNRICGKADAILSTIALGDARAHEQIPKHSRGRFINQDGVIFQGYNYTD